VATGHTKRCVCPRSSEDQLTLTSWIWNVNTSGPDGARTARVASRERGAIPPGRPPTQGRRRCAARLPGVPSAGLTSMPVT
jgi:hypothetical protein